MYGVATHLHGQQEKWVQFRAGLPWFLTMTNEYAREPKNGSVFTHSWSLGVEEKFYLIWPVLAFVLARTLRVRTLVLSGLFAGVGVAAWLGSTYLARAYCGLLMGCLLAVVLAGPWAERVAGGLRRTPGVLVLGLLLSGFLPGACFEGFVSFLQLVCGGVSGAFDSGAELGGAGA